MHLLVSIPIALVALGLVLLCLGDFHRSGMERVRKHRALQRALNTNLTVCNRPNCTVHTHSIAPERSGRFPFQKDWV